jgi:hypothetical protein
MSARIAIGAMDGGRREKVKEVECGRSIEGKRSGAERHDEKDRQGGIGEAGVNMTVQLSLRLLVSRGDLRESMLLHRALCCICYPIPPDPFNNILIIQLVLHTPHHRSAAHLPSPPVPHRSKPTLETRAMRAATNESSANG